jgi:RHS repeat-associated protein
VPDANPSGLGNFDLPLRLPGQRYDQETALHYNYYRDYDPSLGRYGESDPIGLHGGINTYAYVKADPIRALDPLGLFEVEGYPSNVFDKRKYPAKVQELYRYAAELQELLNKACPGNKKAQELFDKWIGRVSPRWADPVTDYATKTTDFTAPFFDEKTYGFGKPGPSFVFMHEFMHLTDSNYAMSRSTSVAEYINAFTRGTSNDLPSEKQADQLVRDLLKGKCPCE